jgi:hypothetical protein
MRRAATADAAGGQAALAAECVTDMATLDRVRMALQGQMAGVDPLSRHEHLELPAAHLERRTFTPLGLAYGPGVMKATGEL